MEQISSQQLSYDEQGLIQQVEGLRTARALGTRQPVIKRKNKKNVKIFFYKKER